MRNYISTMVEKIEFWPSALIGFIVMLILSVLPLPGPLIGGAVSGFLYKSGLIEGMKVGLVAGIFGALVISALLLLFGTAFLGVFGLFAGFAGAIAIIIIAIYNGFFALVGGALGGLLADKI